VENRKTMYQMKPSTIKSGVKSGIPYSHEKLIKSRGRAFGMQPREACRRSQDWKRRGRLSTLLSHERNQGTASGSGSRRRYSLSRTKHGCGFAKSTVRRHAATR
jgi:hypothetical protein